MATTTILNKQQQTLVEPDENLMFDREGFDREAIRQEFAPVQPLESGQRYIEQGQATFVDPDSDRATGPTGIGESVGNIELVRVTGSTVEIPRYTHGFNLDDEDTEVDNSFVTDMRDGIMELFDIEADYAFLQGLNDETGTTIFKGVFQWLKDEAPSGNVIDCSSYDPSAGDLQGVPANIITEVAYEQASGNYISQENSQWDIAAAKPEVWARWNQYGTFDGAVVQSQWDLVDASDNDAGVGVRRRIPIPHDIGLRGPPSGGNIQLSIDMPSRTNSGYSSPLGDAKDDVMFLIPQHNGDFYELREESSPTVRGPIMKDGFRERWEYRWRAGVVQGFTHRNASGSLAQDTIVLENITALFD